MTATSNETVEDGKVVLFHYTLTNDQGEQLDSSRDSEPLPYLHGAGNIVPGLEKQMVGHNVGDSFTATVPPGEAYGEHDGREPQAVPRDQFPDHVQPGMPVMAQMPDGRQVPLWIANVTDDTVFVTQNHPLAGQTLTFDVEITGIRDATDEERQHGHPHGPDGTHSH